MSRFESKVAIVTGGGSGIGADACRRFAREGASVAVADLNIETAESVAAEIEEGGGRARAVRTDVSSEEDVAELVDGTVDAFGGLDVMVNNAGVGEQPVPIEERALDAWQTVIDVHLTGAFLGTKHAARAFKALDRRGVVVNVASVLGLVGFRGAPAYSAAKHGQLGLTKAAALELADFGIRVVGVAPAFIRTPMIEGLEEQVLPLHPMGRLGDVGDVSALILFLASEEAGFLTGATYLTDGGYTAR